MKWQRYLVLVIGVIGLCFFGDLALINVAFVRENNSYTWDLRIVAYFTVSVMGLILAAITLIWNRFFGKHLVVSGLIVFLMAGIHIFPIHLEDYQQTLSPITYQKLNDLLKQEDSKSTGVYLYRSENMRCTNFKPKLTTFLKLNGVRSNEFNLSSAKKRLSKRAYQRLVHRLGVTTVPAYVIFNSSHHEARGEYSITLNGVDQQSVFERLEAYVVGQGASKSEADEVILGK